MESRGTAVGSTVVVVVAAAAAVDAAAADAAAVDESAPAILSRWSFDETLDKVTPDVQCCMLAQSLT